MIREPNVSSSLECAICLNRTLTRNECGCTGPLLPSNCTECLALKKTSTLYTSTDRRVDQSLTISAGAAVGSGLGSVCPLFRLRGKTFVRLSMIMPNFPWTLARRPMKTKSSQRVNNLRPK